MRSDDVIGLEIKVTEINLSQHISAEGKFWPVQSKKVDVAVNSWRCNHQQHGQISGSWYVLSQLCNFAFGGLNILFNDFDNECKNANLLKLAHVQRWETCPLNEAKFHILQFFYEDTWIWHADALRLPFSWCLVAQCDACFHGVPSYWPDWNSVGPVLKLNGRCLDTQKKIPFDIPK